jgi:pimeloyl-ACP methyl ester carboxylesterase
MPAPAIPRLPSTNSRLFARVIGRDFDRHQRDRAIVATSNASCGSAPGDGEGALITERRAVYAGCGSRELVVDGAGSVVVLLHGLGDSADTWRPVLYRLGARGQGGIAVDLPGFGDADDLRPGPKLPQLEAFVDDVVRHHGSRQPVVLVGNSLGGLLTVRAAAIHRGLPVGGILAIGSAGTGWAPLLYIATRGNLALVKLFAKVPTPTWLRRPAMAAAMRLVLYGRWRAADPAQLRNFLERLDRRPVMASAIALLPEVNALSGFREVACPATVLHGGRDRLVSVAAARRLHQAIPHSRLVVLPDSGHCPQLDAPDEVATLASELATTNPWRSA